MRFRAQRQKLFGHLHHVARAFQFVVGSMHAKFDLFLHAGQIFLGLSQLGFALGDGGISFAAVKQVVAQMYAEGPEIVNQEWNLILIAITSEDVEVRNVFALG